MKQTVVVLNGRKLANFSKAIKGGPFIGTVIK
jgi:hypothetical protein